MIYLISGLGFFGIGEGLGIAAEAGELGALDGAVAEGGGELLLRQGRSRSLVEAAVFVESHGQAGVAFAGVLVEGAEKIRVCEDVAGGVILFRKVDVSIRRDLLDLGDIARQVDIHERSGE